MSNKRVPATVSKLVESLINFLFRAVIISLEEESDLMTFAKQTTIRAMRQNLWAFIRAHHISNFTLVVMKNNEKPITSISFQNYEDDENVIPQEYVLCIDKDFAQLKVYLVSNGLQTEVSI